MLLLKDGRHDFNDRTTAEITNEVHGVSFRGNRGEEGHVLAVSLYVVHVYLHQMSVVVESRH